MTYGRNVKRNRPDPFGTPLGFKLWFGFIAVLVVTIFAATGYVVIRVALDPSLIGKTAAEVIRGYEGARP